MEIDQIRNYKLFSPFSISSLDFSFITKVEEGFNFVILLCIIFHISFIKKAIIHHTGTL